MDAWVVCGSVVGLAAQILLARLIVAVVERKRGT
jgi:hypothetical protein